MTSLGLGKGIGKKGRKVAALLDFQRSLPLLFFCSSKRYNPTYYPLLLTEKEKSYYWWRSRVIRRTIDLLVMMELGLIPQP